MSFIIGFFTFILIVDCLLLVLLVLIQLPKKEAGAGLAFGGAATDALFGAGTGNVLTKITKYATAVFFILAMLLAYMQSQYYHRSGSQLQRLLDQQSKQPAGLPMPSTESTPPAAPAAAPTLTNLDINFPLPVATNALAPANPAATPAAPSNSAPSSVPEK